MGFLLKLVPFYWRWIAFGVLILAAIAFGWVKRGVHDQSRYDALQASYEAFKAKVAGEGIAAQQHAVAVQQRQKEVNDATVKGLETDLAAIRSSYASAAADLGRVRSESDTYSGQLSQLAKTTERTCSAENNVLSGRLDDVEREVFFLLKQADEEHARYVALWRWSNDQAMILK